MAIPEYFLSKKFDIEHALSMYAYSYVYMPAFAIYDESILEEIKEKTKKCHIYIIGEIPKVDISNIKKKGNEMIVEFLVLGNKYDIRFSLPNNTTLVGNGAPENPWHIVDSEGQHFVPSDEILLQRLNHEKKVQNMKVLYIGQAFGEDGSRNALDRLKKHETLQRIAVTGVPDGYMLDLLLLEIVPATRLVTLINPKAKDSTTTEGRIKNGIDKIYTTDEAERTTLYEAALIRYFQPKFNKIFKDSFPSTNMKILRDCYQKDISAIIAEICFDALPFTLWSDSIEPKSYHTSVHDLHKDEDRKVFFSHIAKSGKN